MTTTMTTTIKDNNGHAPFVRRMTWLKRIVYLCISTIAILWCWQSVVMTTISSSRKNKNKDNTNYYSYSYDTTNHKNHANYDHNSLLLHQQQQQPKTNTMNQDHHDNNKNVMMMEQQHHPYYHRPAHRITQHHNNDPQQQQQQRRRRRRKTKWHLRKRPQPQDENEYDDTNRLELRQQEQQELRQQQEQQDYHVGSSRPPFLHKLKKDHSYYHNNNHEEQDEEEWEKSRTEENSDGDDDDEEDDDEEEDEEEEEDETDKAMFQAQLLKSILQADWQLIDLKMNRVAIEEYKQKNREEENSESSFRKQQEQELDYTGYFTAMFCPLNWTAYETNPSQMHMFHHLVSASNCEEITGTTHGFDLYHIVQAAKHYDAIQQQQKQQQQKEPRQMPPLQQQYHEQQYHEQYQEQQQYRRTQYDKDYNNYNNNAAYSTFSSRPTNKLVQTLDFAGAVFHESRCGSTLTSNLMQWHNPMENLVYSESGPPSIVLMAFLEHRPKLNAMEIIRQSQQQQEQQSQQQQQRQGQESSQVMDPLPMAIQILQDVFYLMSRTNRMEKRRVLFKMTPTGGLNLPLFQAAFPHVPWIFLYRDPVEVLMSHLKVGWRANCAKSKYGPNGGKTIRYREVHYMMHDTLLPLWYNNDNNENTTTATATAINVDETLLEPINLSLYDYCATFLATMSETFAQDVSGWLSSSTTSTTRTTIQSVHDLGGIPVNYKDVPDLLIDTIWPKVWNLTIDDESRQRMEYGSHAYSKSAGRSNAAGTTTGTDKTTTTTTKSSSTSTTTTKSATTTFTDDSKFKQDTAPPGLKMAATTILQPSYQKLNRLAEQAKELLKTLPP